MKLMHSALTATDLKDFWRSDHYGELSRPAFVIENL